MAKVKVTVLIPDDLHRQVKAEAARRGDTLTRIVTEALHRYLVEGDERTRWRLALARARRLREAQRARRGKLPGPDAAELVREGRERRTEQIEQALRGD